MLAEMTVGPNDAGQRVDRFVRRQFPAMSLDRLQSLFRRKEIKVARKHVDRNHILQPGDQLRVYGLRPDEMPAADVSATAESPTPIGDEGAESNEESPTGSQREPQVRHRKSWQFRLPILHEDHEILVIDKPAGLAVHPGSGILPGDSVIEQVRAYLEPQRIQGEQFQPSLVHRLDKDTSGVLLIAKTGPSLRRLNAALRDGAFEKNYLALVAGKIIPPDGEISGLLTRVDSRHGGAKSEVAEDEGKWSVTRYRTVKDFGNFSLLGVIIETGRMHQIRAHLAHIGHPLVGDARYGSFEDNRRLKKSFGLKRIFLHAASLDIDLGMDRKLRFRSPLPQDLASVIEMISASGTASA